MAWWMSFYDACKNTICTSAMGSMVQSCVSVTSLNNESAIIPQRQSLIAGKLGNARIDALLRGVPVLPLAGIGHFSAINGDHYVFFGGIVIDDNVY